MTLVWIPGQTTVVGSDEHYPEEAPAREVTVNGFWMQPHQVTNADFTAFVEANLRKPTYADFMALRNDVNTVKGWWKNGVARILLNFFLTSLGTAIGVWIGGARMLSRLFA